MSQKPNNIAVIGAGAWGTALAHVFSGAGKSVTLYARDPALAAEIGRTRQNAAYLPGFEISSTIRITSDVSQAISGAEIVLLVTPAQFIRETLEKIRPHLPKKVPLVSCAKGIEMATGKLLSEVAAETIPDAPYAVLSGPTFAAEVARGLPTAVTFATAAPEALAEVWAEVLSTKSFRPYLSFDPVGAEISGAIKNVIAIACGIVEGRGLGQNARAAIMTRGIAEIKRFGMAKGAEAETFLGLSGIGDLTLTCHSMASRNFSLGVGLGQGRKLKDTLAERRTVTEGVTTAKAIADCAHKINVEMPISAAVNQILHHAASIDNIVHGLLSRDLKRESY